MIIKFEGRDWEFNEDKVTVQQAIAVHLAYGLTLDTWLGAGMKNLDPRAVQATYWLMLQQNGVIKTIKDLDFTAMEFLEAWVDAKQAEDAAEKAAKEAEGAPDGDPTQPSESPPGSPPAPATRARKSASQEVGAGASTA